MDRAMPQTGISPGCSPPTSSSWTTGVGTSWTPPGLLNSVYAVALVFGTVLIHAV
jgi:hypothetical protein